MNPSLLTHRLNVYKTRLQTCSPDMADFYLKEIARMEVELAMLEADTVVKDLITECLGKPQPITVWTPTLARVQQLFRDETIRIIEHEPQWSWRMMCWGWSIRYVNL